MNHQAANPCVGDAQEQAVIVAGLGAVSPAGWGVPALMSALEAGAPLPVREIAWPGHDRRLKARTVPVPNQRPAILAHPRLRRASPITGHAVAAALEALGDDASKIKDLGARFGILFCVMAGGMSYSRRFFDEVLRQPGLASPLLFPETVFNAPASHLSAVLETTALNYTFVTDAGGFLQAAGEAGHWLLSGKMDACLVVAAEELDWSLACGFRHYSRQLILAEGAGAVYLKRGSRRGQVCLDAVTHARPFSRRQPPVAALAAVRNDLPSAQPGELLCDSRQGLDSLDGVEKAAWAHWKSARLSPKIVLGEGLAAASAWQWVAAAAVLRAGRHPAAVISACGPNQQAIAARLVRG